MIFGIQLLSICFGSWNPMVLKYLAAIPEDDLREDYPSRAIG